MSLLSEKMLQELTDPNKVTLHCGTHRYFYSKTGQPNYKCNKCMMVQFIGLIANTAPEKRQETVEMLEESIHHLIEAAKQGRINPNLLRKHPKVSFERDVN